MAHVKFGDKSVCATCGLPIIAQQRSDGQFARLIWVHNGANYRHPAKPKVIAGREKNK